jgi:DNA-binding SARP family transcriptional activator
MIELRVLGALDVRADHGPRVDITQPRRLALLLYLALAEPAGLHARDRLLALLWPDADEASARHSLRNALHSLRRALGEEALLTRGDTFIGLDFSRVRCDVLALRAHLAAGRKEEAVSAWAGELVPGFHVSGAPEFERWLDQQRDELHRAVRAAAWTCADARAGQGAEEVEAVRRAVRLDPAGEPGARRLMQLLAARGDLAGALRTYQELSLHLTRELDAEPTGTTRALAEQLRKTLPARPIAPLPTEVVPEPTTPPPAPPVVRRRRVGVAVGALALLTLVGAVVARRPRPAPGPLAEAERAVLRLPARYRADTSAYSSYLRGLTLRFQFRFVASRDTLAALVDRAPLYVPGLYGLAHAWIFVALNDLGDQDAAWRRVDALARRALALDSTAASAWLALASIDMFRVPDLPRAGERILRARALDADDPDVAGMRSVWFRIHGAMDSALAESERARQLDPLSVYFARLHAKQLFLARKYDESWREYGWLFEDDPRWTRGLLDVARLFEAMDRPRDAVEWYRRARLAQGDSAAAQRLASASTEAEARLRLAEDARTRLVAMERDRAAGRRIPFTGFVLESARLRDTAATLRWLDSMAAHREAWLHQARLDPALDFLRGTAGYRAWEARSGLPPLASTSSLAATAAPDR